MSQISHDNWLLEQFIACLTLQEIIALNMTTLSVAVTLYRNKQTIPVKILVICIVQTLCLISSLLLK